MILYPAIDLKGGACVRLVRGEMASATVFNTEPAKRQDYVHHPRHMLVVKRQCDTVGAECVVVMRESLSSQVEHNKLLLEFLLKHLKVE